MKIDKKVKLKTKVSGKVWVKSIDFNSTKFDEHKGERQEKGQLISDMKTDTLIMKREKLEETVDQQEQNSRRNWLLLHGITEK